MPGRKRELRRSCRRNGANKSPAPWRAARHARMAFDAENAVTAPITAKTMLAATEPATVAPVPQRRTGYLVGCHADVVHEANAEADHQSARMPARSSLLRRSGWRYPQPITVSAMVKETRSRADRNPLVHRGESKHGDEMGGPSRRGQAEHRASAPEAPLAPARGGEGVCAKTERRIDPEEAYDCCQSDEPKVVLLYDAIE